MYGALGQQHGKTRIVSNAFGMYTRGFQYCHYSHCFGQVGEGAYQEGSYLGGAQQPWGRGQGQYQGHMGTFNPITGHYTQEPNDPAYARSVHDFVP